MTEEERKAILDATPKAALVEAFQENIRSRKQGRSIRALTTALSMNRVEREIALKQKKQAFKEKTENDDESFDPLMDYIEYAEWLVEMTPDGYGSNDLETLLHDATNRFAKEPRYKNDVRYLKLCIEYSKWVEEPLEIFSFLVRNKIGCDSGEFYHEYASHLESLDRHEDAIKVYQSGIERNVRGAKKLKKNLESLISRVDQRIARGIISRESDAKKQMNLLKQQGRSMLGHKSDSRSRYSVPANVRAGIQAAYGSPSTSRMSFGNDGPSTSKPESSFTVFRDEPSSSSSLTTPPPPSLSRNDPTGHIFKPTRSKIDKAENRRTAADFVGVTIPQAERKEPVHQPFVIFRDEMEPEPKKRPARQHSGINPDSSSDDLTIIEGSVLAHGVNSQTRLNVEKEHRKRLEKHFKQNEQIYFESHNTKGQMEIIAVSKATHSLACFEEDRIHYQGIKYEKPKDVPGDGFELFRKQRNFEVPDIGYTTETRNARELVNQQLFGQNPGHPDDEDVTWTSPFERVPVKRKHTINENE
ncbi:hypothetical protein INT47_010719 [Mucor saturninus]|uniref:BUB1 N-terminal domain-containing protein n=1 Tax=Mucor saturninus TaxID=64648 RepID=A0A8H7R0T0_9FUNG|nr:hypothetical protein INT47_010719 [Mucor saturninus]